MRNLLQKLSIARGERPADMLILHRQVAVAEGQVTARQPWPIAGFVSDLLDRGSDQPY